MIRCVLFDVDGVLIESDVAHFQSMDHALREHGFTGLTNDLYNRFGTISSRNKLKAISRHLDLDWTDDVISSIALRKFELLDYDMINFNTHLESIVDDLRKQKLSVGVVTNARYEFAEAVCKRLNVTVDCIISNTMGLPGKPSPDMYQRAMHMLSSKGSTTLVYEDSPTGITAATIAKCNVSVIDHYLDLTPTRVRNDINSLNNA